MHTLAILFALLQSATAIFDHAPQQTAFELGAGVLGFSPMPTGVMRIEPRALRKRELPNRTCGYIDGNFYNSITCGVGRYCAANTGFGVLGCCTSYSSLSDGEYTYTGCNLKSHCYDSTDQDLCTGSCADNSLIQFCTDSASPYCQTFSLTDLGLSGFACSTAPDVIYEAQLTPTTTFSYTGATQNPSAGINDDGNSSASGTGAASEPSSTAAAGGGSSSKSSVVGPAVGGAVGGLAVILIAMGGFFWLRMKHKKQKATLAATAATAPLGTTGSNVGPGGAYGVNEQKNNYNGVPMGSPNPDQLGPPTYTGPSSPQMAQTYPQGPPNPNPTGSPQLSEMPAGAVAEHNREQAQTYSEVEGSNLSTTVGGSSTGAGRQIQRKSVGTSSLVSGSAGDRTELDNTSAAGQPRSPVSPAAASPAITPQPQQPQQPQQAGMGFQSGPVGDWNKPYHELE